MDRTEPGTGGDIIISSGVIDVNTIPCLTFSLSEQAAHQLYAVFGDALRDGTASVDGVDLGGAVPSIVTVEILRP